MASRLNKRVWVLSERLYIHANGVDGFSCLLDELGLSFKGAAYSRFKTTQGLYGFMSRENYDFAKFFESQPAALRLRFLKRVLFDRRVLETRTDNWNYYGEFINTWYPELLRLLALSGFQVDLRAKSLLRHGREVGGQPPPKTPRRLRVFLCHASEDRLRARRLYRGLRALGVRPWLDARDLLPGQEWRPAIELEIRKTDAIIVCLSRRTIEKTGFVQKEIRIAIEAAEERPSGSIFIIPVRFEACKVPGELTRFHYTDLFAPGGEAALAKALSHRARHIGAAPVKVSSGLRLPLGPA